MHPRVQDAWFQYRVHSIYMVVAVIVTAGAQFMGRPELMHTLIKRASDAIARLDMRGALEQVLSGRV